MSDFSVRSDNVDVEQIMRQIRARIREKRGVDYTEEEIRELANVKLEKFIDPKGVRSNLLEEYRRLASADPAPPNFAFEEDTLFETHRAPIRWLRRLFRPFLKLLFNPNPLIKALHIQSQLNEQAAQRHARFDTLHYEVIHNLVVELTRTGVEVKSLKMRLESISSRLDFDERRARALEGVVQYRPGAVAPLQPPTGQDQRRDQGRRDQGRPQGPRPQGPPAPPSAPSASQPSDAGNALDNEGNERRARRRRRRGRRRPGEFGRPEGSPVGPTFTSGVPGQPPQAGGGNAETRDMPPSPEASAAHRSRGGGGNVAATGEGPSNRDETASFAGESRAEHEPVPPKPQSGEGG
jgi:hypothetical protein